MNREQVVEVVANIEREFTNAPAVSQDSLKIWFRQIASMEGHAQRLGLPTTKMEQLAQRMVTHMTPDTHAELQAESPLNQPQPQPIKAQTFEELKAELQSKAGGAPIQVIANPVNADGTLSQEMLDFMDQQGAMALDANGNCPVCGDPPDEPDRCNGCGIDFTASIDPMKAMAKLDPAEFDPEPEPCGHNNQTLTEEGLVKCADCNAIAYPEHGWRTTPPPKTATERKRDLKDLFGEELL